MILSARKQKGREERSMQSDVISDVETLDVMLGTYPRNDADSELSENGENMDRRSKERQTNSNRSGEDFGLYLTQTAKE